MPVRTPLTIIAVLLAILVPLGFATEKPDEPEASTPVATIARRVETLRRLRYREVPVPVRVTPQQAKRDGLADFDRQYPPAQRRADEALYTTLGLLPKGTDLRDLNGSIFGSQVAGYYDPRTKRLRIVEDGATSNRVLDEMTIAHELTHALEDQVVGLDLDPEDSSDDRGYARLALVEGTATTVMYAYIDRYFAGDVLLSGLLGGSLAQGTGGTEKLPPFTLQSLIFPYAQGQKFVTDLVLKGDGWTLVDLAERTRPPTTTEQILHPQKWIDAEPTLPVTLPSAGTGWTRVKTGTLGEFQTQRLLALGGGGSGEAAAGWGGDRYALDRSGDRYRVTVRWRFDTPRDVAEFVPVLRRVEAGAVTVEDGVVTLSTA